MFENIKWNKLKINFINTQKFLQINFTIKFVVILVTYFLHLGNQCEYLNVKAYLKLCT